MRTQNPIAALERLTEAALAVFIDADDRGETTNDHDAEHDDWRELRLALIECGALPNAPRPSRFDAAVEVVRRSGTRELLDDPAIYEVVTRKHRAAIDREMKERREADADADELFDVAEPGGSS